MMMRPGLLRGSSLVPATYIASGLTSSGGTINLVAAGAQIGDLIILVGPRAAIAITGGLIAWSPVLNYTWGTGSAAGYRWRILDSTASISVTSTEVFWVIMRGATFASRVFGGEPALVSMLQPITLPTPAVNAVGQLLMGHQVIAGSGNANSAGWVNRLNTKTADDVASVDVLHKAIAAGGTSQIANVGAASKHYVNGIELRAGTPTPGRLVATIAGTGSGSLGLSGSSAAVGDLMVLVLSQNAASGPFAPTGPGAAWTQIGSTAVHPADTTKRLAVYTRKVLTGETASTFTFAASSYNTAILGIYREADSVVVHQAISGTTTTLSPTPFTPGNKTKGAILTGIMPGASADATVNGGFVIERVATSSNRHMFADYLFGYEGLPATITFGSASPLRPLAMLIELLAP